MTRNVSLLRRPPTASRAGLQPKVGKPLTPLETQLAHLSKHLSKGVVAYVEQNNKLLKPGFFKLPREIRDAIYPYILRPERDLYAAPLSPFNLGRVYGIRPEPEEATATYPNLPTIPEDWQFVDDYNPENMMGCTKILILCKQTYVEVIELLQLQEVRMTVKANSGAVFRRPDAFGMPGFFRAGTATSRIFTPPRFCELQFARLRHVELLVDLTNVNPLDNDDYGMNNLKRHLRHISGATHKSTTLQSIKIGLYINEGHLQESLPEALAGAFSSLSHAAR